MYWFYIVIFKGQTIVHVAIAMNGEILLVMMLMEVEMLTLLEDILNAVALSFGKLCFSCQSMQLMHFLVAIMLWIRRLVADEQ